VWWLSTSARHARQRSGRKFVSWLSVSLPSDHIFNPKAKPNFLNPNNLIPAAADIIQYSYFADELLNTRVVRRDI